MDIRIPHLAEGVESGVVVSIHVKEGDSIRKDQTLLELETKKAVAPIPSPSAGKVVKIHVKEGEEVSIGQIIISIVEEAAGKGGPLPRVEKKEAQISAPHSYESKMGFPPPASPAVRKMARELGIDLTKVRGSERGGRITLEDLKAYVEHLQGIARPRSADAPIEKSRKFPAGSVDFSKWGPVHRERMSELRRAIAEKMVEAWTQIPHVTQFDEVDITPLVKLKEKFAPQYEKEGARLTLTVFALKAVVDTLKKYPIFNSSLDEVNQEIIYKDYYHIGIAVATEQGLIVPVLRDVDKKNLFEISKELGELAERTRQRKVSLSELEGGTFTISNQGGIGGRHFTPIIRIPEVAILGLGQSFGMMLPLALSYDHRVIDGAQAAFFIREMSEAMGKFKENELRLNDPKKTGRKK